MRTKSLQLCGIVLFLLLAALLIIAFLAKKDGRENLLLILPEGFISQQISINSIEEFIDNEFLLTYEIPSSARISLPYNDFSVTVKATNSSYPHVFGYKLTEGSFFSKQAWTGKQRHAVLNEKAAATIFGSASIAGNQFRLHNETWLVTGVINDGDDERSTIYVPSSIANTHAGEFAALMSGFYDESYIKSNIKTLGIHVNNFEFFNLGSHTRRLFQRPLVIILLLSGVVLIFVLLIFVKKFINAFLMLKTELVNHYISDMLHKRRKVLLKPLYLAFILLLCPALALVLFLQAVSIILPWQDIPSPVKSDLFFPLMVKIYDFELASLITFGFTVIVLAVFTVLLVIWKKGEKHAIQ